MYGFSSNFTLIASLRPLIIGHPATEISDRLVSQSSILLAGCDLPFWARAHQIISLAIGNTSLSLSRSNQTMNSSNLHTEINAPATAQGPQVISSVFGDNANIRE